MNALGIICGAIGGWIVLACLLAPKLGRALKHADPGEDPIPLEDLGEFIEIQRSLPPVPQRDVLMALVPVDCLTDADPELHGRFWALVGAGWEI